MLELGQLKNKKRMKRRLGRGNASGAGSYCGRGIKGQRARAGGKKGLKLRGFKKILLTMPKYKGMKRRFPAAQVIYLSRLAKVFDENVQITPGELYQKKLIADINLPVKILLRDSSETLDKKLEIFGCDVSAGARKLIEAAGGKIVELREEGKKGDKGGKDEKENKS
jgi:large subunit ribosomal protein L15